jgi:hypothetical protein
MFMAVVTATLFLRTNLQPDGIAAANEYFSVIFFSLIMLMFDGFAEETLTVQARHIPLCMGWLPIFLPLSLRLCHHAHVRRLRGGDADRAGTHYILPF